jgi:hypothetical protein
MLLYDPPYCYDKDTMILTRTGWKNIANVTSDDEIATRHPDGKLEYHKPTYITKKDYVGKMIEIKNDNVDLLVTPNHNCLVRVDDENDLYDVFEADMLKTFDKPITFTSFVQTDINPAIFAVVPSVHNKNNGITYPEKEWYTVEMMRFIGIFLRYGDTVATYTKNKSSGKIKLNYKTVLALKDLSDREEKLIERTIMRTRPTFHDHTFKKLKNGYVIEGKQLYTYMSQFKHKEDRVIPQCLKECSHQEYHKMLTFLFAYKSYFKTSSKQFAYDLQEIILKAGHRATITKDDKEYTVKFADFANKGFVVNKEDIKEIDFEGEIYCVSVPNFVVMVQRNGKPCWCGNSPRQVSECYKNLGQTVNMETTQASYWSKQKAEIGRIVKDGGYVITCSWNSGGIGKKYGFEIVEILLVPHGGWHNDTIVVVEKKTEKKGVKDEQVL